jgi:hypothetical protein
MLVVRQSEHSGTTESHAQKIPQNSLHPAFKILHRTFDIFEIFWGAFHGHGEAGQVCFPRSGEEPGTKQQ